MMIADLISQHDYDEAAHEFFKVPHSVSLLAALFRHAHAEGRLELANERYREVMGIARSAVQ